MDNLKSPAHPVVDSYENGNICSPYSGFTKLELASLMIAQGYASQSFYNEHSSENLAQFSVSFAKAVLEQANK